jgi:hypothetical protein
MAPTIEKMARTDAGLAAALRISVARLTRRLRSERDPRNELSIGQLSVLGALYRNGACSIGSWPSMNVQPSMTGLSTASRRGRAAATARIDWRRSIEPPTRRLTLEADRRRRTSQRSDCASSRPKNVPCCDEP